MKRFGSLVVVTSIVAGCVVGLAGVTGASAASTLPTLNVAVTGKTGIAVSGSTVSGAVSITSTFSGKGQGGYGLIRLDQGVSFTEALDAVKSHHGDPNALTPFGSLFVSADAPGTVQTVLTPGNYVALNLTGNGPERTDALVEWGGGDALQEKQGDLGLASATAGTLWVRRWDVSRPL